MIKIIQPGMYGTTQQLLDMHRMRTKVFREMMKWDVKITDDQFEIDQFDTPNTLYMLAFDLAGELKGSCRLVPTTQKTMIREIWPEYLQTIDLPNDPYCWELSRFAVVNNGEMSKRGLKEFGEITAKMFLALAEIGVVCGIKRIYAMHDQYIERLVKRINCTAATSSAYICIDGIPSNVGCYVTDERMLETLRFATQITENLIDISALPPALEELAGFCNFKNEVKA